VRRICVHFYNCADATKNSRVKKQVEQGWLSFAKWKRKSYGLASSKLNSRDNLIVLSGNDGDDAKPYQVRDVNRALRKMEAVSNE
jgi:hypothetical protein